MEKDITCIKNIDKIVRDNCVFLEPQSVFNYGIIKYNEKDNFLIYSYDKLIEAFIEKWSFSYEEAIDWLNYNTIGYLQNIKNPPEIFYDNYI